MQGDVRYFFVLHVLQCAAFLFLLGLEGGSRAPVQASATRVRNSVEAAGLLAGPYSTSSRKTLETEGLNVTSHACTSTGLQDRSAKSDFPPAWLKVISHARASTGLQEAVCRIWLPSRPRYVIVPTCTNNRLLFAWHPAWYSGI